MSRIDMLLSYLEKEPNDSFLNYALALEYSKDNIDKAIEILEKVISNDENYLGAYYQLGKYYEQRNDLLKAISIYKKGKEIAKEQMNTKTLNELCEALMMIEEEE
jgi:tetratricopeptide (TPR) repeat protein